MENDFRYIAYFKENGEYAHFGYSPEMAIVRAQADLDADEKDLVVVDMRNNGWKFVQTPYVYHLNDALLEGKIVETTK